MYNEEKISFENTLNGIYDNIESLKANGITKN